MIRTNRAALTTGSVGTYTSTAHPLPPPPDYADDARSRRWSDGVEGISEEIVAKRQSRHQYLVTPSGVCGNCLLPRTATVIVRRKRQGYVPQRTALHTGDKK